MVLRRLHTIVFFMARGSAVMIPTVEVAFGSEIKKARKALQKSQEALAFDAEIHRTYVSLIERGQKSPTLTVIVRLSKALNVKPSELIRRVEIQFE